VRLAVERLPRQSYGDGIELGEMSAYAGYHRPGERDLSRLATLR
jgi:hypothetical protein